MRISGFRAYCGSHTLRRCASPCSGLLLPGCYGLRSSRNRGTSSRSEDVDDNPTKEKDSDTDNNKNENKKEQE